MCASADCPACRRPGELPPPVAALSSAGRTLLRCCAATQSTHSILYKYVLFYYDFFVSNGDGIFKARENHDNSKRCAKLRWTCKILLGIQETRETSAHFVCQALPSLTCSLAFFPLST